MFGKVKVFNPHFVISDIDFNGGVEFPSYGGIIFATHI